MRIFRWGAKKASVDDDPLKRYDLNPDKLAALDDLQHDRKWVTFMGLIREIAEEKGAYLLVPDEDNFRYWQGYISALRFVQNLIPDLVDAVRESNARRAETGRVNGDPDKRSLIGSPYWDLFFGPGSTRSGTDT